MTIWILALVLLACLGCAGLAMGVIRAGFSFIGSILATCLAFPLGHMFNSLLSLVGLKNPFLVRITGPFLAFLIVLIVFKIAGFAVHQKVDVYYKYKAGDTRMGFWNRLNPRLGLCFGLMNGTIYLILISLVIYIFSYATNQMVIGDNGTWSVRMLNLMGQHVHSTGMAKVVAGLDPMPDAYYDAMDVVGLVYHNDLVESRLSRYPAFLTLGERPEFQDIANDKDFTELRQKQPAFADIINHPKAQAILNNPDLLNTIWTTTVPNLKDLKTYLKTGQSALYDSEAILGRWAFDLNGALNVIKKAKPNLNTVDMQRIRRVLSASFSKSILIAAPDKTVIIRNFGTVKPATTPKAPPTVETQTLQGQWAESAGKYQLSLSGKPDMVLDGVVEADKLTLTGYSLPMRFEKEY